MPLRCSYVMLCTALNPFLRYAAISLAVLMIKPDSASAPKVFLEGTIDRLGTGRIKLRTPFCQVSDDAGLTCSLSLSLLLVLHFPFPVSTALKSGPWYNASGHAVNNTLGFVPCAPGMLTDYVHMPICRCDVGKTTAYLLHI